MDLVDRFMAGLELRDPARVAPRPLDFAVMSATQTLLALADWWTVAWGMQAGLIVIPALLDPKTLRFVGLEDSGLLIATASDGDVEAYLKAARLRTDVARSQYQAALLKLSEFEPDFDFEPWVSAVMSRPSVNPLQVLREKYTKLRTIGVIRLLDSSGSVVDALAVDELGQASAWQEGGWLALFAAQWSGYAEGSRPEIASFLTWLSKQSPYGPLALDEPKVISGEGDLDSFITQAVTTTT